MKILLLALSILCGVSQAQIYSVRIDSSSTNIPASFTSASTSRVLRNILNVRGIAVINNSSTALVIYCGSDSVTPADSNANNIYVPASGSIALDNTYFGNTCYVRSDGSAISSGVVQIMLMGG